MMARMATSVRNFYQRSLYCCPGAPHEGAMLNVFLTAKSGPLSLRLLAATPPNYGGKA